MKLVNSRVVISCILAMTIFSSQAADPAGSGKVNMQGAIIDTACSIATESREQVVNMDVIPIADIQRDGFSRSKELIIHLENCILERKGKEDWKQFQVTFNGDSDGENFGVNGEARGVALQISDMMGNKISPGMALPLTDITPGDIQLKYNIRLVKNNDHLKPGAHFATIRFKLDYF